MIERMPVRPGLGSLDVSGAKHITDAGGTHFASLEGLEVLVLSSTRMGDAGMTHLGGLRRLRTLGLYGTQVSDAGLEELRRSRACAKSTFASRS